MKYIRRVGNTVKSKLEQFHERKLLDKNFIVLSNNCWGYQLYKSANREYNTPFVGLFMYPDCFVKFISNIKHYADVPIEFRKKSKYHNEFSKYPIGILQDDIEIHFLHYKDEMECVSKWNRRTERLKKDLFEHKLPVFAKMCDRDGCEYTHLQTFHEIKDFNKVSFGSQDIGTKSHLRVNYKDAVKSEKMKPTAPDGLSLYKKRYSYFDIIEWIRTGEIKHTLWSRMLGLLQ
jgi:uncharacterized protein (DUF1919 family)